MRMIADRTVCASAWDWEHNMAKINIPTFKLNNGAEIPALGYGTWLGISDRSSNSGDTNFSYDCDLTDLSKMEEALSYAIDIGYRHVDTAHFYRIEPEIGGVINRKIREGVVTRDELFVTTKVWQHFHRPADVEVSLRASLKRLNLDYVDLVLMHWPMSISQEGVDEKIDYVETWRGFEAVLAKGLTKAIGVSNFNVEQLTRLLACCKVTPAINQVEINLNLAQHELVKLCQAHNIVVVAFSPFGTMIPSRAAPNSPEPKMNNPTMVAIANKHNKTVSQIALRHLFEREIVSIPKTVTPARVLENASIFDFSLDQDDIKKIEAFDNGYRTVRPLFWQHYSNYPFDIVEEKIDEIPVALRKWKNGRNGDID